MDSLRDVQHETYTEIEAPNYRAFLDFLSTSNVSRENLYENFLYRGVGDASYELIPAAFRPENETKIHNLLSNQPTRFSDSSEDPMDGHLAHIAAEAFALSLFYRYANSQALPLPPVPQNIHVALLSSPMSIAPLGILVQSRMENWPPPEIWPLLALAQHYGVPTRMLDWTLDPFTAAYFGGKAALLKERTPSLMAVWLAPKSPLQITLQMRGRIEGIDIPYNIDIVEAPYAGNPNLAAQRGVFTLVQRNIRNKDDAKNIDRTTIDQALTLTYTKAMNTRRGQAFLGKLKDASKTFIKLTLRFSEIPGLVKHLHFSGWHGSRLFPGYQGCEIAMTELDIINNSLSGS